MIENSCLALSGNSQPVNNVDPEFKNACDVAPLMSCFIVFSEWLVNQHRDSGASYIGHYNLLDYFALVENESRARTKFNLLEVHFQRILNCVLCSFGSVTERGSGELSVGFRLKIY